MRRSSLPLDTLAEEVARLRAAFGARRGQSRSLRAAAQRYEALCHSLDQGYCVVSLIHDAAGTPQDFRYLEVNPAFENQTGLHHVIGRTMRSLVPAHEDYWFRRLADVARSGEPQRFEGPAAALGRYYQVVAFRIGAAEEGRVGVLLKDISDQRRIEQMLRANEERHAFLLRFGDALRELGDAAQVKSLTASLLGRHLDVSRAFYGELSHDGVLLVDSEYRSEGMPSFAGSYRVESLGSGVMQQLRLGQRLVEPDVRLSTVLSPAQRSVSLNMRVLALAVVPLLKEGELVALLAVHQDRPRAWSIEELVLLEDVAERSWTNLQRTRAEAELKQANDELTQAARHKDEFLAMLAHELRNPLATMAYVLRYLSDCGEELAPLQPSLETLQRQTRTLRTLVDELLDVSRLTRDLVELHKEAIDFVGLVARAADSLRYLAEEKRQDLSLHLPDRPVMVCIDPVRLEQVVVNLLSNALKYTPARGRIELTLEAREDCALLQVRDSGVGMRAEMLARVFDLFAQAERDLARSSGGLGIGLTIVKSLVEMHGGSVKAYSEGLGKGSLFEVRLPLLQEVEAAVTPVSHRVPTTSRRVLVVDDNRDLAEALGALLRLAGHELRVAPDGPRALREAEYFRPEVVLLDIGMPDMDGYELAARLRQMPALAGTRLAALTGYDRLRDVQASGAAGLDAHFVKPAELEALLAFIEGSEAPSAPSAS